MRRKILISIFLLVIGIVLYTGTAFANPIIAEDQSYTIDSSRLDEESITDYKNAQDVVIVYESDSQIAEAINSKDVETLNKVLEGNHIYVPDGDGPTVRVLGE